MKEPLIKFLLILGMMIFVYSCGENIDDELEVESLPELFTIHASEVQGFSGDRYIMATSPLTGETFFSDVMTSFEDNITFDADGLETVDVTYAAGHNTGFNIITYRDVKSEFNLSRFIYTCYEDQIRFDNLSNKFVDIILSGTKEIVEIINPAFENSTLQHTSKNI